MVEEIIICSVIVHCLPKSFDDIVKEVVVRDGIEIPYKDDRTKFVAVIEAENEAQLMGAIDMMNNMNGVLSCAIVYQQTESKTTMHEGVFT